MKYFLFLLCLILLYNNYSQKEYAFEIENINKECSKITIEKASIYMQQRIMRLTEQAKAAPESYKLIGNIFEIEKLIDSMKIKSDTLSWEQINTYLQDYSEHIAYQKCDSIPYVKNIEDALYIFNVLLNNTYIDDIFLNKTAIIQTDSSKYQLIGLHMNPLKVKLNGKEIGFAKIKDNYFYYYENNKNIKINKLEYISFNPITNKTDTHVCTIKN